MKSTEEDKDVKSHQSTALADGGSTRSTCRSFDELLIQENNAFSV